MPNSCFIVTFQTAGILGISAYSTGGPNTSVPLEVFGPGGPITLDPMGGHSFQRGSKYFGTNLKYLDRGIQLLQSVGPGGGGNYFGGVHFFRDRTSQNATG